MLHCGSDDARRCELFSSADLRRLEHDERLQSVVRADSRVTSDDVCTVVMTPSALQSPNTTTLVLAVSYAEPFRGEVRGTLSRTPRRLGALPSLKYQIKSNHLFRQADTKKNVDKMSNEKA